MKELFLLRGLPGSGKSTLAKSLDGIHVEADQFFMVGGEYKFDASKDMPDPTTTTNLKIVEPRYKSSEAYKKEYKKRGNKLLKKIKENSVPDKEDKKNIKLIEDYFKLFD